MFNFAMETLELFLNNTFYFLCHLHQCGLTAGRISFSVAFHELKAALHCLSPINSTAVSKQWLSQAESFITVMTDTAFRRSC